MSQLNPLNDLSRVYLDQVAKINQKDEANDIKRWEEGNAALDKQMETSSQQLATLGAPTMEEEKKAAKDYDGDGKIESGKDEYFGSKDKAIKKAMKKEDTHNYVEAYVTELKKTTLGSYVSKASKDLSDRRFDQGDSEKRKYDPDAADDKEEKKLVQREKGISRAATKLSKEELELDEAERDLGDRLHRKRKLYDKTTRKAMDDARRTGEASGHNRFRMGSLDREMDGIRARMKKETKSESMQHRRNPEGSVKDRFKSRQTDPSKDNFTGIGDDIGEIMRQNAAMKKAAAKKKVKEGRFSDWRNDLSDLIEVAPMTDVEAEKVVKEKKVNNKVTINPKMSEAVAQIGGEVISETEVELQEKQKDTPDQVKAVIAFDRARKGTDDATYDSMHGKKKQAKKERDYAKWQRDKGAEDAQKSGHRWKHAKGSTREKEGKKSETHAYIKDSYAAEGVVGKEVKELQKAGKTLKDTPVVNADKTANPNYKGEKFGVKKAPASQVAAVEEKDWIQKAVKRPGAFTRKAKAAGQTVQQFAKTVDDNPGKYSTRTKRQANLAQTFASMKKEDVEELFYTLIAD